MGWGTRHPWPTLSPGWQPAGALRTFPHGDLRMARERLGERSHRVLEGRPHHVHVAEDAACRRGIRLHERAIEEDRHYEDSIVLGKGEQRVHHPHHPVFQTCNQTILPLERGFRVCKEPDADGVAAILFHESERLLPRAVGGGATAPRRGCVEVCTPVDPRQVDAVEEQRAPGVAQTVAGGPHCGARSVARERPHLAPRRDPGHGVCHHHHPHRSPSPCYPLLACPSNFISVHPQYIVHPSPTHPPPDLIRGGGPTWTSLKETVTRKDLPLLYCQRRASRGGGRGGAVSGHGA